MIKIEQDLWRVEVFFDGQCPLCRREISMLRWMDRRHQIRFTDIADPSFNPAEYDLTLDDFMNEIQGRLPNGEWITGVEVFRQLYSAVGLTPIVWLSRLPGVSQTIGFGYQIFAKNRLRLTGRCTSGSCEIPNR